MNHEQSEPDYSKRWYVMATVAMGVFLATIDGSIVNVALPTLKHALNTDLPTVQWVVLAYLLVITTLLLSAGRLADMFGKKYIYTAGIIVFTFSSVLCGFSPSVYWLIGFRVAQAIGAAMIMALGAAIVTEAFPPTERGKSLGIIGSTVSVGIVTGPALGGLILGGLSWHWIFFVNIPIGIIGTVMALRYVSSVRPTGRQRFDFGGAATLFISLAALLLALTFGQDMGFGAPLVLGLFVAAVLFMLAFLMIEWKTSQPIIDLSLFRNDLLSTGVVAAVITFVVAAGLVFLLPFHLEEVAGYTPQHVGLLMGVAPIMLGISAPIAGSLSDRFGTRPITVVGLLIMAVSYYGLTTIDANTTTLGYVLLFIPVGIGTGIFQSPNNSAIMGTAPRSQLGVVSGLLANSRVLGQTIGTATIVALWASRVFMHAGGRLEEGATTASHAAQLAGLQDTFFAMFLLIFLALLLSLWAWFGERGRARSLAQL
jgi:EmrB/QacA subfamily drug resistance transporter